MKYSCFLIHKLHASLSAKLRITLRDTISIVKIPNSILNVTILTINSKNTRLSPVIKGIIEIMSRVPFSQFIHKTVKR